MAYSEHVRRTPRRIRIRRTRLAGLLVAIVAIAAAVGSQSRVFLPSTTSWPSTVASPIDHLLREPRRPLGSPGEADGAVPHGTTVFDDGVPGVAKLDPALLGALRRAAAEDVELVVNSGWRSPAYEEQLRRAAIATYGSEAEAARWVATGATSPHVSGDAVDIGPSGGAAWLSRDGAAYGLCQVYRNEPWHYELRPEAIAHGCPRLYADAAQDPRLRQ